MCSRCGTEIKWFKESGSSWWNSEPHDIPCPDPSDPAMIVAMLEWIIAHGITCCVGPRWLILHDQHSTNLADTEMSGKTIAIALIDAIDALPQD